MDLPLGRWASPRTFSFFLSPTCSFFLPSAIQVAKSVEYVQAGTTHLVAAKRLQKNTRKWMCVALILLLIIAAAIAIPIAIKLA